MFSKLRQLWRRWASPREEHTPAAVTTASTASSIPLHEFNAQKGEPLEQIFGVDSLTPSDPQLPTWIPGELEMQLWITAYLDACPTMFDEGTLDYLGPYLRSQEELWLRASHIAEHGALTTAHRIRSVNEGHLLSAHERLNQLKHRRAELALKIVGLNARLDPEGLATR